MEIAPSVHRIPGVTASSYLIVEPTGLTLIDAGLAGSHNRILKYIADLGRPRKSLKRILITHADGDHVGGLAALRKATDARIMAHPIEAEAIRRGEPSRELQPYGLMTAVVALSAPFLQADPVEVDEYLRHGQMLPVLGGLYAVETPGHTPGHISLFAPQRGILFVGDSVVTNGGRVRGSRGANTWNQMKADASVRLQATLKPQIVCPGHGEIILDASYRFPLL